MNNEWDLQAADALESKVNIFQPIIARNNRRKKYIRHVESAHGSGIMPVSCEVFEKRNFQTYNFEQRILKSSIDTNASN